MGKEQKTQTVRRLTCTLTEEEYRTKSEELTKLLREKAGHEAQKSASAKYYKELIDDDETHIEDVLPVVETGQEERDVKCEIVYNSPEKGLKTVTRLDTMEKVATEEMTADECQDLFLNHEDADTEESDGTDGSDEEPEPVVLKALPPPEPKALPAEVIEDEPIVLEDEKFYLFKGVKYESFPTNRDDNGDPICYGCAFEADSMEHEACKHFDCDTNGIRLVEAEEQAENPATPAKCSKCGHNPGHLYHVSSEKVLCEYCMERTDGMKKAEKFFDEHPGAAFEYRAVFGYACTSECQDATCFQINQKPGGYASWGMNHYKAGNYQTPGTPAHDWAVHLNNIGGIEA